MRNKPWNTLKLRGLRKVTVEAGLGRLGPSQIIKLPEFRDRTLYSVASAIHDHGFANSEKSERVKNAGKLSRSKKEQVIAFLKTEGKYWPAPLAGERFSVSATTILRCRKQAGVPKFSHQECMTDPVYQEWWKQNRSNRVKNLRKNNSQRRGHLRNSLEIKLWAMQKRINGTKLRRCKVCGTFWPKLDDFFHRFRLKKNGRYTSYLSSTCLACPRKAKRRFGKKYESKR